ncbi:MAG: hypothetical protein QOJ52_4291 [Acidimicrobiaceae bacterium]|nr:hypothetical protein [Acidimicrobiaceae bacterium]
MPQLLTIHLTPGWTGGKAVGALRLRPERSDLHLPAPTFRAKETMVARDVHQGHVVGQLSASRMRIFWTWHIGAPPRSRRAGM